VEGISFLASTDDCVKAINAVSELKKAIFIADMSEYEDEILNMVLKISSQNEDIKIIALSEKVDTSTTIKAMRAGVSEIIRLPIVKDKFVKSLKNIIGISTGQVVKQKKM
jgi:DNA-binding NtrC family response regulator